MLVALVDAVRSIAAFSACSRACHTASLRAWAALDSELRPYADKLASYPAELWSQAVTQLGGLTCWDELIAGPDSFTVAEQRVLCRTLGVSVSGAARPLSLPSGLQRGSSQAWRAGSRDQGAAQQQAPGALRFVPGRACVGSSAAAAHSGQAAGGAHADEAFDTVHAVVLKTLDTRRAGHRSRTWRTTGSTRLSGRQGGRQALSRCA